jgi:hypothetical protein
MGRGNSRPVERIKLKRKDGKPGVATNRDGSTYEAQQVEFATVWDNGKGKSATLAPGFAITYNGKSIPDSFINIFSADKGGSSRKDADEDDDF